MLLEFFDKLAKAIFTILTVLFIIAVLYGVDVLISAILVKLLSLLFDFTFTWKIAFISAAILAILQMLFSKTHKSDN